MALILPIKGVFPQFGNQNWQAPNATIVGDVQLGDSCTVWFNAVIRGDVNKIRIGHHSNIQDGAVIHCTYQKTETTIGNYVSMRLFTAVPLKIPCLWVWVPSSWTGHTLKREVSSPLGRWSHKIRVCLLVVFMQVIPQNI
jgi:hypothetical protein